MTNSFEGGPEHIPTKEEVMAVIGRFAENPVFVRELSDEQGIYLLELKTEGEKPGETTRYVYVRKGSFSTGERSSGTVIYVAYYKDEVPLGGHDISNFDYDSGRWE